MLEAHREYQEYVATGVMTPRVFAMQFLDGHHYIDDGNADNCNLHRKALGIVAILLSERTDLVERFFSKTSLESSDVDRMIFLVYTEGREEGTASRKMQNTTDATPSLNCRVKKEDWVLLAECANHASFFKGTIDAATIGDLLHCRLSAPLVADNLMGGCLFL